MKIRVAAAMLTLTSITLLLALSGCGKHASQVMDPWMAARVGSGTGLGGDSVPPPPPPPPPPPTINPVAFAGSDSAYSGTTAHLRWVVGNEGSSSFRVDYTLSSPANWQGLPQSGSITVPGNSTLPLTTLVAVPADAATGMVEFALTVTRPRPAPGDTTNRPLTASAGGWLRVVSTAPPPPPPPPPVDPVKYLGADSVQAGGTVTQQWQLTNESTNPFSMHWTLSGHAPWPGLPQTGSVTLAGGESRVLTTTTSVPDTVSTGYRWLRLTVTRPDGLPDASTDGPFYIRP